MVRQQGVGAQSALPIPEYLGTCVKDKDGRMAMQEKAQNGSCTNSKHKITRTGGHA